MRRFFLAIGVAGGLVVAAASWPARADVLDYLWGHSGPPTLADVAKMIDHIQHTLVSQGTVVIKQPDVWSQARMTQFRQEYEDTMAAELSKFDVKLAGRIARSDALAFASQTAVAGSISPLAKGEGLQLKDVAAVAAERDRAVALLNTSGEGSITSGAFPTLSPAANFNFLGSVAPVTKSGEGNTLTGLKFGLEPNVELDQRSDYITHLQRLRRINLGDDNADSAGYGFYLMRVPLSIQPGAHTNKGFGAIVNLTISHDFNPRFLQATYRNLVINDLVDKLTPAVHELIRSGAAANYEFLQHEIDQAAAQSLPRTPEDGQPTLAVLVNKLTTIAKRMGGTPFMVTRDGPRINAIAPSDLTSVFRTRNLLVLSIEAQRALGVLAAPGEAVAAGSLLRLARSLAEQPARAKAAEAKLELAAARRQRTSDDAERAVAAAQRAESVQAAALSDQLSRTLQRSPTREVVRPLGPQAAISSMLEESRAGINPKLERDAAAAKAEADEKAAEARKAEEDLKKAREDLRKAEEKFEKALADFNRETKPFRNRVRLIDVRAYLRGELEAAYDLVDGHGRRDSAILQDVEYIESLVDAFYGRQLKDPDWGGSGSPAPLVESGPYEDFLKRLPGDLSGRGLGALAWGVALEAGLLNRHLQEDMKQTKGANDYCAPPDVDIMCFYVPEPPPEIERAFEDYVRARWPMITFALEPVADQQNIEDAFSRSRDIQVAVAFALASGRISFRQAMQFRRIMQYEAQTISLNQTVAAFANGNDTFGWRITPRYQTPPEESNFRALANTILGGGPGPNYQLANSKIEPGMRELTVMVVMPSFVRGVRVDSSGDWFKLADPEWRKLRSARAVEIGRRINEARDCLELACKHANYRPEDVERLRVRLRQLEAMLPLQTAHVRVPYENTLGGFALFSQGKTDLVPRLDGFDGLDYIDPEKPTDLILHGRNFSLYETSVIVGGKNLAREGTRSYVLWDKDGTAYTLSSLTNPIRDENGNLVLQILGADNKPTTVTLPDPGSYLIQSREVMRARIPRGVATVKRADGSEAVEVNVSTPTGVSNRLLIPVRPAAADQEPVPPIIARAASARIVDDRVIVRCQAKPRDGGGFELIGSPKVADGSIVRIIPNDLDHPGGAAEARISYAARDDGGSVSYEPIQFTGLKFENGCYVLTEAMLNELVRRIEAAKIVVPSAGGSIATSEVTLLAPAEDSSGTPASLKTTNQLNFAYEFVLVAATGPVAATEAAGQSPAPLRDGRALRASAGRIVIPPPAPPTAINDPPVPPRLDPIEPRLQRVAFQAAGEAPAAGGAPSAPPAGEPAPAPAPPEPRVVIPPPVVPQAIVVAPQPSVNVSVPITNNARPPRLGLLHRDRNREPATPQNPERRSLLQRVINGP